MYSIFLKIYAFCYKQTSPLGVPLYAFGYPLQAQFVHSSSILPILEEQKSKKIKVHYLL